MKYTPLRYTQQTLTHHRHYKNSHVVRLPGLEQGLRADHEAAALPGWWIWPRSFVSSLSPSLSRLFGSIPGWLLGFLRARRQELLSEGGFFVPLPAVPTVSSQGCTSGHMWDACSVVCAFFHARFSSLTPLFLPIYFSPHFACALQVPFTDPLPHSHQYLFPLMRRLTTRSLGGPSPC